MIYIRIYKFVWKHIHIYNFNFIFIDMSRELNDTDITPNTRESAIIDHKIFRFRSCYHSRYLFISHSNIYVMSANKFYVPTITIKSRLHL